ncbi:Bacterial alpha-L-rhamnosidase [Auraticoccus sp. F435]|uniref:alpha-L-rhamnosidase n=1 Tax=Auraticoccus cholistanensis TaxID=2656650 RepID=A0A6A9V031_9ACTN|nr:family 78 glycoside hydrolase catalytic domain [Auraticoccus cholistanensis]MVA74710.1 Bacterial alpha-L-rhamnosidase [Auraticoccus cholistanensis]
MDEPRTGEPVEQASWITHPDWVVPADDLTAPPVLQRSFVVGEGLAHAEVDVMALGVWVLHVNGRPVDDALLRPGMSEFARRVEVVTLDLTDQLEVGRNVLTLELGEGTACVRAVEGRYTKYVRTRWAPMARVGLRLRDRDGSSQRIDSDERWEALLGPTRLAHWYGGEEYDARLEPAGWRSRDAVAGAVPAVVVPVQDGPVPWRRSAPPVRVVERLGPLPLTPLAPGVLAADAGRNLAGRQVLQLGPGTPAGVRIETWPAEYLDEQGRVDQSTTGSPIVDGYTTAGGPARWAPQFGYHGFRHLELRVSDAATGEPVEGAERWLGCAVERLMTDDTPVGTFECSDPALTGVHRLVEHAVQSNLYSVPTDCPHREKLGWLEQAHLVFRPVARMFDVEHHWAELVTHMADAQTATGLVPDTAPELVVFDFDPTEREWPFNPLGFRDDVNWGGAVLHVPLQLHRSYATLAPLREAWPVARRYLQYLADTADGALLATGLGDWITEDVSTPASLVAGYGHARLLDAAVEAATLLGEEQAAAGYAAQAREVRQLLHAAHVRPPDHTGGPRFGSGSQASTALLLHAGVLSPEERRAAVADLLAVVEAGDRAVTVGEIGLPALVDVLLELEQDELLHEMLLNPRHPSYRTMLDTGLTALAESWRGASTRMSANHFMLGYVDAWLTEGVGGLSQAEGSVGWARAVVRPRPVADVTSATTRYDSPRGRYAVAWRLTGGRLEAEVRVPDGGAATVQAPPGYALVPGEPGDLGPGEHRIAFTPTERTPA